MGDRAAARRKFFGTVRRCGFSEDDRVALTMKVTGHQSTKDLSEAELLACTEAALNIAGLRDFDGPYAAKFRALWIAAHNLGITRSADDRALVQFVSRQTGIDAVRWVRRHEDASPAVEGLKAWIAREGGVRWSSHAPSVIDGSVQDFGRIAESQWALLHPTRPRPDEDLKVFADEVTLPIRIKTGYDVGDVSAQRYCKSSWHKVMNVLGANLRARRVEA